MGWVSGWVGGGVLFTAKRQYLILNSLENMSYGINNYVISVYMFSYLDICTE